jgi:ABC-type dipeptide/oligopeptide/nickel transport system permease component
VFEALSFRYPFRRYQRMILAQAETDPGDGRYHIVAPPGSGKTIVGLELIRREMGLDKPVLVQYGRFLAGLARADFGFSYRQNRPVIEIIAEKFPATLKLAVFAIILSVLLGVSTGLLAAVFHRKWVDQVMMFLALLGISTPVFWLGLMLILFFASWLGWFPVAGYGDNGGLSHLFLPGLSLSAIFMGYLARMTRSSLLDVLNQDYITTARAKGLPPWRVYLVHGLKNAALPVVTVVGTNTAGLLTGAIATEYIFAWPGLGRTVFEAIMMRDRPVILGGVLFFTFVFVAVNTFVDVFYTVLDKRLKLS